MPSIREMQGHIKSIESIGQLTRALQAVSASQVQQATQLAENYRPYTELAWQVLIDLYHEDEFYNQARAFLEPREIKSALIVFISADRGLAGGFPMKHTILKKGLKFRLSTSPSEKKAQRCWPGEGKKSLQISATYLHQPASMN